MRRIIIPIGNTSLVAWRQAAHSRVLEAKREEATKQLREVKIEVRCPAERYSREVDTVEIQPRGRHSGDTARHI